MSTPLAFLLDVSGPDGRTSDWALAVLDPDTLAVIERRRTAYARSKAEDRQYYEAYYFDSRAVDFLANGDADDTDDGDADPADAQDARDALDVVAGGVGNGSVALDEPVYAKLSQHPMARVECVQMIVRESGLMWMCYPKHTDMEIRTAEITWATLGMEAIRVPE